MFSELVGKGEGAAFAAAFFFQMNLADHHAFIHGFEHVVNGEQSDVDAGERFHFHAGLAFGAGGDAGFNAAQFGIHFKSTRTWVSAIG